MMLGFLNGLARTKQGDGSSVSCPMKQKNRPPVSSPCFPVFGINDNDHAYRWIVEILCTFLVGTEGTV